MLTDAHWALPAPLLPGRVGRRGVVVNDNRGFVEAVLWVGRTGLPWRDLPPHLGQWHRVFVRFSRNEAFLLLTQGRAFQDEKRFMPLASSTDRIYKKYLHVSCVRINGGEEAVPKLSETILP